MDNEFIYQLAYEFRSALEIVSDKRNYGRLKIFASFPDGCCGYTSDLLAEYLIENGIQRERIQVLNGESDKGNYSHCWLMIDDMHYIDITADQFSYKPHFEKYSPIPECCIVPKDTYFFERFTNRRLRHSHNVGINSMLAKSKNVPPAEKKYLR